MAVLRDAVTRVPEGPREAMALRVCASQGCWRRGRGGGRSAGVPSARSGSLLPAQTRTWPVGRWGGGSPRWRGGRAAGEIYAAFRRSADGQNLPGRPGPTSARRAECRGSAWGGGQAVGPVRCSAWRPARVTPCSSDGKGLVSQAGAVLLWETLPAWAGACRTASPPGGRRSKTRRTASPPATAAGCHVVAAPSLLPDPAARRAGGAEFTARGGPRHAARLGRL